MINLNILDNHIHNKMINEETLLNLVGEKDFLTAKKILAQFKIKVSKQKVNDLNFDKLSKIPFTFKNTGAHYNVSNSCYLQPNIKPVVLDPKEEYLKLIDIQTAKYAKNLLANYNNWEYADEEKKTKLSRLTYKISRLQEQILLSYLPLVCKKLGDFFHLKLHKISNIDDYISECFATINQQIENYDITIGGELKAYLWFFLTYTIRSTYGKIGGNFTLNVNQVIERTKIYNLLQKEPQLSHEDIAKRSGFTKGTKPYFNFIQRLQMYECWQATADNNFKENDYYAGDLDNYKNKSEVDTFIKNETKMKNLKNILNFVSKNFSSRDYEMFKTYFNVSGTNNNEEITYQDVADTFKTTKQNVFGIIKKIKQTLVEAKEKGLLKIEY